MIQKAVFGFQGTCIYPINLKIFWDADFTALKQRRWKLMMFQLKLKIYK